MSEPRSAGGRWLDLLANVCMILAAVALVVMTMVQAWQVFARYVLNNSPGWTEPVALLFMSLAVMLGSAVAVRRESHFAFLTLRDAMPRPLSTFSRILARLIAAASGAALMLLGGQLMLDDWAVPLAGAQLPSGLKFIGLCVGGALILVFAVERLLTGDYVPTKEG